MEEVQRADSLTSNAKAKLCSSLLHKIRVIQGQTSLNLNEPDLVESKDCVRLTKDIINNIKEGLKKGCSDVIKSCEERSSKFSSETNSSITAKPKTVKKRRPKSPKSSSNRSDDKQGTKQEVKHAKSEARDAIRPYEGGERAELVSSVKLPDLLDNKTTQENEVKGVSNVIVAGSTLGKCNKRKKRRKRKRDEIEVTSSMTINQSKSDMRNHLQGDVLQLRNRMRRNKERNDSRTKRPECAGDESDIEDLSCRLNDDSRETNLSYLVKPKRKLRIKRSKIKSPSSASILKGGRRTPTRDIREMVSTTIARLNTVNESVQKVIEESLSSGASSVFEKTKSFPPFVSQESSKSYPEVLSYSSLNWSTVTMSKSTVVDPSEGSVDDHRAQIPSKTNTKVEQLPPGEPPVEESVPPPAPPPTAASLHTATDIEEIASPRRKKKKQRNVEEEKLKEVVEVATETEVTRKKKKTNAPKAEVTGEPVSSMKKSPGKRTKNKKREHVDFASTPELLPDYPGEVVPAIPPRKSTKITYLTPNSNVKEQRSSPPKPLREDGATTASKKAVTEPTRRIHSARTYRNVPKKELTKIKSASQLDSSQADQPITVRAVLQEEAKNCERRKRSGSRTRSRSRGENRSGTRPVSRSDKENEMKKTRDVKEIYQKMRSNTTSTIANINEQMSSTLKESIAHLNEICGKVRTTLTDMEKDEETYKRLKSKKSFEVSSEGGSVCDGSSISVRTNSPNKPAIVVERSIPKAHTYTIITQARQDTSIGQMMNTISMAGDNALMEQPHRPQSPTKERAKKKTRESKKRPSSKQSTKPAKVIVSTVSPSKTKFGGIARSTSSDKSAIKIPIWQRKPPSVIEEIQLTVKKQATKSQYREFLRALKNIAKKQRSQMHVVPQEFKEIMEKQQDKVYDQVSKTKSPLKKKKDGKLPPVETHSNRKICKVCSSDKCTCGVTVENTTGVSSPLRMHWMRVKSDSLRRGIQAYDILDEITLKDLEPIQSEYPRRDHIHDADANKRVEDTLLYKLLYHEDPKVLESLLSSHPQPAEQKQPSRLSNVKTQERAKSVSDAYKLYEQLEFNVDKQASASLAPVKGTMCLSSTGRAKEKPQALHTCPKEFNDELVIPADLKPTIKSHENSLKKNCKRKYCQIKLRSDDDAAPSMRSKKRIEDKMKIIGKTSSIKSITKRIKKGKFSKENIKTRLKSYNGDSKIKVKKILTIMPVSIYPKTNSDRVHESSDDEDTTKKDEEKNKVDSLKICEENMEKIRGMSKREIVQILKPYIFYDLQPPVVTVMPVLQKYNHQNKHQKQDHTAHLNRGPTYKKVAGFLKDHDDDCHSGKKLCRRCQMVMQSGDETSKKNDSVTAKKPESLSQRQLWKNKYKPTPAENLVNRVLGKNSARKKFEAIPPEEKPDNKDMVITISPKELNRNAVNTRNKLREVKDIVESHKPLLGQDLNDIIDTLEFKIVDALSNPKNQHTDAFNDIEHEIKSILNTISDLKEINRENIRNNNLKFKSKTSVILEDSSDPISNKSSTDTDLIESRSRIVGNDRSIDLEEAKPAVVDGKPTAAMEKVEKTVENDDDKELDKTYCALGKDIEKVIEGLDAIMNLNEDSELPDEKKDRLKQSEVKVEADDERKDDEEDHSVSLPDCEKAITTFCQQVDEVMKNIENIDDMSNSMDNLDEFVEAKDIKEKKSDDYLTPFMKAVKNYREHEQHSQNFVDFLDKLAMLSRETVSLHIYPKIPVYTARIQHNPQFVEVAKTYSQAIQYEELSADKVVEVEEDFHDAIEVAEKNVSPIENNETKEDDGREVLSTNQWMQTEEINEEESVDVRDQLIQTSSTEEQFNEVEEYLESLHRLSTPQTTMLIAEKKTQVPSDVDHSCFAETFSKDVQVTSDLLEMTSATVGNQADVLDADETTMTVVNSIECQINLDAVKEPIESVEVNASDFWKMKQGDETIISPERYANNRMESCFDGTISDLSFDEYPRNVYTESYITGKRNCQDLDSQRCNKRNSYPTTRKRSDIISLFESRKSSSDTNDIRDFLDNGFTNNSVDSYDSMLARYASSENVSKPSSSVVVEDSVSKIVPPPLKEELKRSDDMLMKLDSEVNDEDKRHKHLLHSLYGIVFVLMFLSINLNYTCCN